MKDTKFELAVSEIIEVPSLDKKHPYTTIARFVFADDKPNFNNQAISVDEFDSIAASSIGMPVKMKYNSISAEGHEGSIPIGVIRSMTKNTLEDGTNQLIAEAILWADEYPSEVQFLKDSYAENAAPGISWELGFTDSVVQKGIEWLKNVVTRAATFVKTPAYGPRTALLALASLNEPDFNNAIISMAKTIANEIKTANSDMGDMGPMNMEDMMDCGPEDALVVIGEAIQLQLQDNEDGDPVDQQILDLLTSARDMLVSSLEGDDDMANSAVDPNVGGGVDRKKIAATDFAGKNRSFPIVTPQDVADAAQSLGRAGADNYSPEEIRRRIIAIAKRKGPEFEAKLPESWKSEKKSNSTENKGGQKMEEELTKAQAALESIKAELAQKVQELSDKDAELSTRQAEITALQEKVSELTRVNTTETRIRLFTEAGLKIDTDAERAAKKREFITSLTDAQWDEYLAEKVADAKEAAKAKPADFSLASASHRGNDVPKFEFNAGDDAPKSITDLKTDLRNAARS